MGLGRGRILKEMLKITMTDNPSADLKVALRHAAVEPLIRFNEDQTGRHGDRVPLVVTATDSGTDEILGALVGEIRFAYLHIGVLYIAGSLRRAGIGRRLMKEAEKEAARRGCVGAWVDSYSFQAPGFYQRLGYTVFGEIADYPPGHRRVFLMKTLGARDGQGTSRQSSMTAEGLRASL
jgi:ribosomal protein S18 acetylase RimI-like enzyme